MKLLYSAGTCKDVTQSHLQDNNETNTSTVILKGISTTYNVA